MKDKAFFDKTAPISALFIAGDIIAGILTFAENEMSKLKIPVKTKKLNILALVSFLLIVLTVPLLLIPWSRLFILRSDQLSTYLIHIIGLFVIGLAMLITGILAVVKAHRHKETYKGNWMGIVGIVLGAIFLGFAVFIIIGYLVAFA